MSPARSAPTAVILQSAVHLVIAPGVDGDVVELADGGVVQVVPVLHAVAGDIDAAVAAQDHMPAVAGVDPEHVVVGVDAAASVAAECLAAVRRAIEAIPST